MADLLNYAEAYGQAVDERYAAIRTSDSLWKTPANNSLRWDGPNHVKVPMVSILDGRRDRKRNNVALGKMADYSNDWEDFKLSFDREWETSVDPRDVDDTNGIMTIAKITDEFNRTLKIPEQDKYMYSKLFKEKVRIEGAENDGIINLELTEQNVLRQFDKMMTAMDEAEVEGNRTLYITPAVNELLKNAQITNRFAMANGSGDIQRTVHSLDDVTINVVPSSRMKTDYDFTVGAADKAGAQQIQMFLIAENVHVAPDKYQFAGLQEPSALTQGNYLYYESEFADVFMFQNKSKGYAAVVKPADTANAGK